MQAVGINKESNCVFDTKPRNPSDRQNCVAGRWLAGIEIRTFNSYIKTKTCQDQQLYHSCVRSLIVVGRIGVRRQKIGFGEVGLIGS